MIKKNEFNNKSLIITWGTSKMCLIIIENQYSPAVDLHGLLVGCRERTMVLTIVCLWNKTEKDRMNIIECISDRRWLDQWSNTEIPMKTLSTILEEKWKKAHTLQIEPPPEIEASMKDWCYHLGTGNPGTHQNTSSTSRSFKKSKTGRYHTKSM